MEEIVKHINDTNASYRAIGAGDAKNTDLFLDNEHYELFRDSEEQITVRYNKENLTKAILFIASILPRKYDNSAVHKTISFSTTFVYDQLAFLEGFFTVDGVKVESRTQKWNARKDVLKSNGEIDKRFYFNGLLEDIVYINYKGERKTAKFTIRNYFAGGYSDLHIKKASDGIFDIWITNTRTPYDDGKDKHHEIIDNSSLPLQQIFYGAPGTGKSNTIKKVVDEQGKRCHRTTFHPDSDYSTFVGTYKPTMKESYITKDGVTTKEEKIIYTFCPQAFTNAYVEAWNTEEEVYLVIEEINRGNCAQIFGDLFQLLDRKNGVSEYPVEADADQQNYLNEALAKTTRTDIPDDVKSGDKLMLPSNLYIWATMNTSDQSLFPIDSAFKRRWEWKYMKIRKGKDENGNELDWKIVVKDKDKNIVKINNEDSLSWWDFIEKINEIIASMTSSADKQLGYFFCKADEKADNADKDCTIISANTFVGKVLFYLWNDVFKDYGFDDASLFRYKETIDGKETEKDLTFPDFYDEDGENVNVTCVVDFVQKVMNWKKKNEENN